MTRILRTPKQQQKDAMDQAIYKEWTELTKNLENSRMAITDHLAKKYNISRSTVWAAMKRVEKRMAASHQS